MTTDSKLTEILSNEPKFFGVFTYDQLPTLDVRLLRDKVLIFNYITEQESQEGKIGHFSVLDFRDNTLKGSDAWVGNYYFGPYGFKPDEARNIMGLPNPKNVNNLLNKMEGPWKYNTIDFQSREPWDSTCGVYSAIYVKNPNFQTNPIFFGGQSRSSLDHKLVHLFDRLKVLGPTSDQVDLKDSRKVIKYLAK